MNGTPPEIVEYIYEKLRSMMMPITEIPATLRVLVSPIKRDYKSKSGASLAFGRSEFRELIGLLVGFERHGKDPKSRVALNADTSLSRLRTHFGAVRKHDSTRDVVCKNYTRLCELYDFLYLIDEDFIAYMNVFCFRSTTGDLFNTMEIEFSIGLGGFDLVNSDGVVMNYAAQQFVTARWGRICSDCNYFNDFSRLIGTAEMNAILFMMDYTG